MMTKERKGEIAYMLWKEHLKKEGIRPNAVKREIGNIVKATGIDKGELFEFVQEITCELLLELSEKVTAKAFRRR